MGWSGHGIMSGDATMDWQDMLRRILRLTEFDEEQGKYVDIPPDLLEKRQDDLSKYIESKSEADVEHYGCMIGFQVLGVMMLTYGAKMNKKTKALILENTRTDHWATQSLERYDNISYFFKLIEENPGEPTQYWEAPYEGYEEDKEHGYHACYSTHSHHYANHSLKKLERIYGDKEWIRSIEGSYRTNGEWSIVFLVEEKGFVDNCIKAIKEDEQIAPDFNRIPPSFNGFKINIIFDSTFEPVKTDVKKP